MYACKRKPHTNRPFYKILKPVEPVHASLTWHQLAQLIDSTCIHMSLVKTSTLPLILIGEIPF